MFIITGVFRVFFLYYETIPYFVHTTYDRVEFKFLNEKRMKKRIARSPLEKIVRRKR